MIGNNIVLFCGGRGSANLIRALVASGRYRLTLLVNAYDDGLSTGRLREFLPGFLGPSDIRKNLTYLMDLTTDAQFAALEVLDYRLPADSRLALELWNQLLREDAQGGGPVRSLRRMSTEQRRRSLAWLKEFETFRRQSRASGGPDFDFRDCGLGNLLLAGAFLESERDFNRAVSRFTRLFQSQGELLNVTQGENLYLVGLRRSGEVCFSEAELVGRCSPDPVVRSFLLDRKPGEDLIRELQALDPSRREAWLEKQQVLPDPNPQALEALREADLIIYGPGSQSSSLWPSYLTRGVGEAIQQNSRAAKVFLVNLRPDNDTQNLSALEILRASCRHLRSDPPSISDQQGVAGLVSHVFVDPQAPPDLVLSPSQCRELQPAEVVTGSFEHEVVPGTHSGFALLKALEALSKTPPQRLVVVLQGKLQRRMGELYRRQLEDLRGEFRKWGVEVSLTETDPEESEREDPPDLRLYIGGPGLYSMRDIFVALDLTRMYQPAVVCGSRVLRKSQFEASLKTGYLNRFLRGLAWWGALVASAAFAVRFGQVLSDPLSEFVFVSSRQTGRLDTWDAAALLISAARKDLDILEIPVSYQPTPFSATGWARLTAGGRKLLWILFG